MPAKSANSAGKQFSHQSSNSVDAMLLTMIVDYGGLGAVVLAYVSTVMVMVMVRYQYNSG